MIGTISGCLAGHLRRSRQSRGSEGDRAARTWQPRTLVTSL